MGNQGVSARLKCVIWLVFFAQAFFAAQAFDFAVPVADALIAAAMAVNHAAAAAS